MYAQGSRHETGDGESMREYHSRDAFKQQCGGGGHMSHNRVTTYVTRHAFRIQPNIHKGGSVAILIK